MLHRPDDADRAGLLAGRAIAQAEQLAVALGAPAGSLIATFWDWHGTFIALAALGTLCAAVLWWKLPGDLRAPALPLGERLSKRLIGVLSGGTCGISRNVNSSSTYLCSRF